MRSLPLPLLLATLAACGNASSLDDLGDDEDQTDDGLASTTTCAAGKAGAACVISLYDTARARCTATSLRRLRAELDARRDLGPLWARGRALFRTDFPLHVAGSFNSWSSTSISTEQVCGTDLAVAVADVPSGSWQYKLTDGNAWVLDWHNPAFAYDDFSGNADGKNSTLVTPDAGRGQLVNLAQACSTALGNCRPVTAYLPPGYDAPENAGRRYPVLFMHDGQNVWDDHDCCFGHTGWEVNVTLDAEIAAGRVAPLIVIAAGNTPNRNNEYGLDPTAMAKLMQFQVTELQPEALAQVRWDNQRVMVAGSSLGGLLSMHLALEHPQTYRAGASLSGSFWVGQDDGFALRDKLPAIGKQPVAIYLDHGGNVATNSDGAADSVEIRDRLDGMGWDRRDSPACAAPGPDALCYYMEPWATHDELAWKARTWRFLRFLSPP
jgi:predicted alpha/beta superfamily hydrolase